MAGMTLEQFSRAEFWRSLEAYKKALAARVGVMEASLRVHAALGRDGVPVAYKRYVSAAFRGTSS